MYGYAKQMLHVDLTTGEARNVPLSEELLLKYVGGRGLGAALLAKYAPQGVDPFAPEAPFFLLTGPLSGTIAPGAAKYVVGFKSPVSGGYCDSYASGRISVEMKCAGYDVIMVTGRAQRPAYILVQDQKVTVEDASALWGRDTFDTETELRTLHGEELGVACIGPAGENLSLISIVNSDYFRQAARGGVGAVWGSKKLKAIAVRGSAGVKVYDGDKLLELVSGYKDDLAVSKHAQQRMKYGTALTMNFTNSLGMLPTRNFSEGSYPPAVGEIDGDGFVKDVVRNRGCLGCMIACSKIVKAKEGMFKGEVLEGPEYESLALLGSNLYNSDRSVVIRSNLLCDKLGLDTISAGGVIGFLMECYEKGLVTREECNGLDAGFGNKEAQVRLLEDVAYRRGIGDVLADGVREAARRIGQGSEKFAMHVKGLELPGYEPRGGYGVALAYAVCPRGGCHRRAWPPAIESLGKLRPDTTDGKANMVKKLSDSNCVSHTMLVCDFPIKMAPVSLQGLADIFNAVTGQEVTEQDLYTLAERVETTIRLYNNREGLSRSDDTLPDRVFEEPLGGPIPDLGKQITREDLDAMLNEYYALRGWDREGRPGREWTDRLGIPGELGLFPWRTVDEDTD